MLKYFPLLLLFFSWSCGGDTVPQNTENQSTSTNVETPTSTTVATDRIETPEQMQALTKYALTTQQRIFSMDKEQSLSYTIGDNVFNFELYREENGDTLAIVNNGGEGRYREFDRYIFYQDNRPVVMLVDQMRRDVTKQMYIQLLSFYNSVGMVQPTAMTRRNERKADLLADKFRAKDLGEVHNVYQFVDEFKQGMKNQENYTLYFDDFITEEGRSFLRLKAAEEPTDSKYFITAVRLPENFREDATLAKIEKNPQLYQNKKVDLEWETIKMKTGQRIPQWVSGAFE